MPDQPIPEGEAAPAAAPAAASLPAADALRAITLDLDDTLWPVLPTLVRAERVLQDWLADRAPRTAATYDRDALRDMRILLVRENPDRAHDMNWLREEGLRRALVASGEDPALATIAFDVFLTARQDVRFYDDVLPMLRQWSERFRLVAISNGNADVDRVGLGSYFHASISAHRIGIAKPDPRIFLAACDAVGVAPSQTLHVGDDLELDVVGARNAGLHAAWLRRPELDNATTRRLIAQRVEPVWESLGALQAHLDRG